MFSEHRNLLLNKHQGKVETLRLRCIDKPSSPCQVRVGQKWLPNQEGLAPLKTKIEAEDAPFQTEGHFRSWQFPFLVGLNCSGIWWWVGAEH